MNHSIGIIGAGNMARSLAGGLLANGFARDHLSLSDPDANQRRGAESALGLTVLADNRELAARCDVLVLAVKPQVLRDVAGEIAAAVQTRKPLVVSVAAGIRITDLERWLGGSLAVVRVMPNTAALIGSGASGLFARRAPSCSCPTSCGPSTCPSRWTSWGWACRTCPRWATCCAPRAGKRRSNASAGCWRTPRRRARRQLSLPGSSAPRG